MSVSAEGKGVTAEGMTLHEKNEQGLVLLLFSNEFSYMSVGGSTITSYHVLLWKLVPTVIRSVFSH